VKLHSLRSRDIASIAEMTSKVSLLRRYGWDLAKGRKILKKALADPSSDLIVAKEGSRFLGFAWVVRQGGFARSAYLRLIAVDTKAKRRGIGRLLMREMERRHLNPSGLLLLATSTNQAARRFYEKLGYRRVGLLRDYVRKGLREVIYFKPCPNNS
jgi:ribosomal protein S18 acetylase RimI-like enzyme